MGRYDVETGQGSAPNDAYEPMLVNDPVVFIAPSALTVSSGELWIAVSCDDTNYGGCIIHASNDGSGYHRIGRLHGRSTMGVLLADLPSASGLDITNTLSVDIGDFGDIDSVSDAVVDTYDSLCYVGGELLAYKTSDPVDIGQFNLTHLRRGLYGSTSGAVAGDQFVLLNASIFRYRFNKLLVGSMLSLKFQGFNGVGGGLQPLEDLTEYDFDVAAHGGIKALLSDIPDVSVFVLKAGDTFTGPVLHSDTQVSRANFIDCGLVVYDHDVISSSSTITFDYTQGCVQYCECGGAYALTLAFSNWPPSGNEGIMKLGLKNFGLSSAYIFPTITWSLFDDSTTTDFDVYALDRDGSARLPDDTTATIIIWTRDAGATLYGVWL